LTTASKELWTVNRGDILNQKRDQILEEYAILRWGCVMITGKNTNNERKGALPGRRGIWVKTHITHGREKVRNIGGKRKGLLTKEKRAPTDQPPFERKEAEEARRMG